jgi:acetoacetate decarboxylase
MYYNNMSWFLVKIVFQIICGDGQHKPQFDEQLRLILAPDMNAAVEKSKKLAAEEVQTDELVQWKLVAVTDVYPFGRYLDGAELFSKVTEEEHGAAYIHTLQLKEQAIQNKEFAIHH